MVSYKQIVSIAYSRLSSHTLVKNEAYNIVYCLVDGAEQKALSKSDDAL